MSGLVTKWKKSSSRGFGVSRRGVGVSRAHVSVPSESESKSRREVNIACA